ncbi:MAG: glycosyl hydrolase family 28-related protein [Planctomycetota bacterium]|jgi:hypothetical protein|nr:glycosyl hydrolase family 28-related protein [Planctomycetota bacterium]
MSRHIAGLCVLSVILVGGAGQLAGADLEGAILEQAKAEYVFSPPADAGVINVKDFGATGDGTTDDTAAIKAAITKSGEYKFFRPFVYLPRGTYLISEPLKVEGRFFALIGEQRSQTTIRLQAASAAFSDAESVVPLLEIGGGNNNNQAFGNYVQNLTIAIGANNPGAAGLRYKASNYGATTELSISCDDGKAYAGLLLNWADPGPQIHRNMHIRGFRYGIYSKNAMFGPVFENILLEQQSLAGVYNAFNCLWMRHIFSRNDVPAIINANEVKEGREDSNMIVLVDSILEGGSAAADGSAVLEQDGMLYLRDVVCRGYGHALTDRSGAQLPLETSAMYTTFPIMTAAGQSDKANPVAPLPRLPVAEHPAMSYDATADWVSVAAFGALEDGTTDCSDAIQAAIDSGARTIYFPKTLGGSYRIDKTVHLRGKLRHIVGMRSLVAIDPDVMAGEPTFVFDGDQASVTIEHLHVIVPDKSKRHTPRWAFKHAAAGDFVIQHTLSGGYTNGPKSGRMFVMDTCGAPFQFSHPQEYYGRSINTEGIGGGDRNELAQVNFNGGTGWILGAKTEGGFTFLSARDKATVEVLGGFHYPAQGFKNGQVPLYRLIDSIAALTWSATAHGKDRGNRRHFVQVLEQNGDAVREVLEKEMPKEMREFKYGRVLNMPLYVTTPTR